MIGRLGVRSWASPVIRALGPSRLSPALHINRTVSQSSISQTASTERLGNIINPVSKQPTGRTRERVVLWKIYGLFHRHNTLLSLVGVVEDLDFVEKNKHLSYNEQVLYYLQLPHHTKIHVSAGQLGFRKGQRAEYEAGYQVSARFFKLIEEKNLIGPNDKVELIMRDFGKGREAFLSALQGKEGSKIKSNIARVSDSTKLKFGGVRSKKLRRL